jgi:hypothetical protein
LFERSPFGGPIVSRRQIVENNGLISFLRQDLAGVRADIARASRNQNVFVTALFIQLSLSKQCAPLFRSCRTGISQSAILSPLRPSSADQAAESLVSRAPFRRFSPRGSQLCHGRHHWNGWRSNQDGGSTTRLCYFAAGRFRNNESRRAQDFSNQMMFTPPMRGSRRLRQLSGKSRLLPMRICRSRAD